MKVVYDENGHEIGISLVPSPFNGIKFNHQKLKAYLV